MVVFAEVNLIFYYITIVVWALCIALVERTLILFNAAAALSLAVEYLMCRRLFTFEKSVYVGAAIWRAAVLSTGNSRDTTPRVNN